MAVAELTGDFRTSGRASVPVEVDFVRELVEADLSLLASDRGIKPPTIAKLRDRHHSLARCLAGGMSNVEASAITGYSPSRISILISDPTFKELLTFYKEHEDSAHAEFSKRATMVTLTALDNLQEQVEDEANPLSVDQNLTIIKTLADRTGHAPVSRSVNTNVNLEFGSRMAAARQRLAQRKAVEQTTEAEFTVVEDGRASDES